MTSVNLKIQFASVSIRYLSCSEVQTNSERKPQVQRGCDRCNNRNRVVLRMAPNTTRTSVAHTHTHTEVREAARETHSRTINAQYECEPNKTISKQAGKVKQNSSSRCREAPNAGAFSPDTDLLFHEMARPPGLLGPNLRCRLSLRKCSGEKTYDVLYRSRNGSSKFILLHLFIVVFVLHCCFYCSVCTDVAQSSNSN